MKKMIAPAFFTILLVLVIFNLDKVTAFTAGVISTQPKVTIDRPNTYAYNKDYKYVQKTETFVPYSKHDLMNIFYSIFDNGYDSFTFYCPSEYTDCMKDVEALSQNQTVITDIGNYVHPYNNFSNIKIVTDSLGQVDVVVNRNYTANMRDAVNSKVDQIFDEIITDDMDLNDKILRLHDYIIDHVVYDQNDLPNSGNAYGVFIEGRAKCSGYADAMAIVLHRLGVQNYKVASAKHVWNAIYLEDGWSHIDLTWDDPVVEDGTNLSDTIRHKFYRIDTPTLLSYDTEEHGFDKNVYIEVRK